MNRKVSITVLALVFLLSGIDRLNSQGVSLSVALRPQLTDKWCWAASAQMVMEFLGVKATQCDEANKRFGEGSCCDRKVPRACIRGGCPEFDKYGFTFLMTAGAPLSWDDLRKQINDKKPFTFTWIWNDERNVVSGHMMVVAGYKVSQGTRLVLVNDPWPPPGLLSSGGDQRWETYRNYVSGPDHTHGDDYYEVK